MQSAQAQHLPQWIDNHIVESHDMFTDEQVLESLNRRMDAVGRVVMYLAISFGIITVIVQLWKLFQ